MATVALTGENFESYVDRDGVLLIDWWAPWCGPCRVFGPIYETASERHSDVTFAKINTEDQPDLAATFEIQAIPTLMVFRDRVLVFARPGAVPAPALDELIGKVKELDMDDVRRQVAEQEAQGGHEHGEGCDHGHDGDDHQAEDHAPASVSAKTGTATGTATGNKTGNKTGG